MFHNEFHASSLPWNVWNMVAPEASSNLQPLISTAATVVTNPSQPMIITA